MEILIELQIDCYNFTQPLRENYIDCNANQFIKE